MELKSLGYRTQLIFTSFDGKAEDRGDYWAIHTLSNPNFFWGNLLIFSRPPLIGDFENWTKRFKEEFKDPRIYHVTCAWQSAKDETGDVSEFLAHDFLLESTAVLSTTSVTEPPKFNSNVEVRKLRSENEWQRMIEVQVKCAHDHLSHAEWELFYRRQAHRFQRMEAAGYGRWYGAFLEGNLVGGLGIFYRDGLGRFQIVSTDPDYQRRGICQTLVYLASRDVLTEGVVRDLVMCADPEYHAIRIYESVGFERQVTEHGVYWWDKEKNP